MKLDIRRLHLPFDWPWVQEQVPVLMVEDTTGFVAVNEKTGDRIAACVMDNWTNNSVQVHLILTTPMILRHGFMEFLADFLFRECSLKYVYGFVPGDNERALKLNRRLGYEEVYRMPDAFEPGVDYVIMCLTPERCIYFNEDRIDGEEIKQPA